MQNSVENISYFVYELDYGREYREGCVSDKNGNIDISTPEKLYDYLMAEYAVNNGNDNVGELR